ncbi:MAG: protoporphyrinogen oxidase HemJ [Gammaproteobacteria bacterium]|nr:MAG: protoporphyrinogen oxidase HemJ [Gammaproteobacteria bacterium]
MLWVKALHLFGVICWFAGLFYLPRLFVYHAMTDDQPGSERFKLMERKLYRVIMTPSAVIAVGSGVWLLTLTWRAYGSSLWLWLKLALVGLLIGFHLYCGRTLRRFAADQNLSSDRFFRWFNEMPVLVLLAILVLVVVKPF